MSEPETYAVRLTDVGCAYVAGQWIFRSYSAAFRRGHVVAILGPNGCGKTTLLRTLTGALKPAEGHVEVDGDIAFVPQLFETSFGYTALDMVLMGIARKIGLFAQPSRADRERALVALDHFGLGGLALRPFHEMSGGQRQLVIFARALLAEADTVILDEPTSALDLRNQGLVIDWIRRLSGQHGMTVIFTTHQPNHALAAADEALVMLSKTKLGFGPAADVLDEGDLSRLYGVPLKQISVEHEGKTFTQLATLI